MISLSKKIFQMLVTEGRNRGIYFTILMNISHLIGILRGFFIKLFISEI
ncbi:hypothetical protein BWGOE8_37230 [Bacillus mycoides]|uniref:Uncharacterized protein n=1 Tax=Bacillus mycoides TaxID=1405 RepID=A0A1E8B443_BACMY|nr:hypothetical protein BWGOE9_37910 [Bacillus mycoides]OFD75074.1 hypothetical protein BWGOE8_37230 [Bacillus mycoides]OFD76596.1 hypothetical protein BWGOE10_37930 [Bacillus mycoides]